MSLNIDEEVRAMTAVLQRRPSIGPGVNGLLLLGAAWTAAWLGLNAALTEFQDTGVSSVINRLIIHAAILTGLWVGLARTDFDSGTRIRVWVAIAVPFTAWLAIVWW